MPVFFVDRSTVLMDRFAATNEYGTDRESSYRADDIAPTSAYLPGTGRRDNPH